MKIIDVELKSMADALVNPELEWDNAKVLADRYLNERHRIACVLAEFFCAPLSMSSVQPILDLAVELNPEFQRSLPGMTFQDKSSIMKEQK